MFMARMAQLHQGKPLQLVEATPSVSAQGDSQLAAGGRHRFGQGFHPLPVGFGRRGQGASRTLGQAVAALQQPQAQGLQAGAIIRPGQQSLSLLHREAMPMDELELHAGQVKLASHGHRQTAQITREVGLEVKHPAGQVVRG